MVGDAIAAEGTAAYTDYRKMLAEAPDKSTAKSIKNIKTQEARHQRTLQRIERKHCLRRK